MKIRSSPVLIDILLIIRKVDPLSFLTCGKVRKKEWDEGMKMSWNLLLNSCVLSIYPSVTFLALRKLLLLLNRSCCCCSISSFILFSTYVHLIWYWLDIFILFSSKFCHAKTKQHLFPQSPFRIISIFFFFFFFVIKWSNVFLL